MTLSSSRRDAPASVLFHTPEQARESFGPVTDSFSDFGVPVHVQPPPASANAAGPLGQDEITPLKSG
jgi:hypothetical protein